MPNLNSLQLYLEGNIPCRSAVGQRHRATLVNEVFCVVFQMTIEAKGAGSGVTLHAGMVLLSELTVAFKSHMIIQIQTPNSSKLYISECGLKTEACPLSA